MPICLILRYRRFSYSSGRCNVIVLKSQDPPSTNAEGWAGENERVLHICCYIDSLSQNNWLQMISWCHAILHAGTELQSQLGANKNRSVNIENEWVKIRKVKIFTLEMRIMPDLAEINHRKIFYLIETGLKCASRKSNTHVSLYKPRN